MTTSKLEATILKEHEDKFPVSFIKCIEEGTSWLCIHNGITYQSSLVVKTDKVLYNTSDSDILKIGLIDTAKPLSGLVYYGVSRVDEVNDTVSGGITFMVSSKYQTPVGIKVNIIPFKYYEPSNVPEEEPIEEFSEKWFETLVQKADPILKAKLGMNVQEAIDYIKAKANQTELSNYYTKEEADNKFTAKS